MNSCINRRLVIRGYKVLTAHICGKIIGFALLVMFMGSSVYAIDSFRSFGYSAGRLMSSVTQDQPAPEIKKFSDRHYEEIRWDLQKLDSEDNLLNGHFVKTAGINPAEWILTDLKKLDNEDLLFNRPFFTESKGIFSMYYRRESKFPYPENSSDR